LAVNAAKPDFAYPASVSANAGREISAALRKGDDRAAMRAMVDWSLAEMLRDPDGAAAIDRKLADYQKRLRSDAARGLTLVLRRSVSPDSTKYLREALSRYEQPLRAERSGLWLNVIDVDTTYLPTLYDFAAAQCVLTDSLAAVMRQFHAAEPAPLAYWTLQLGGNEAEAERLYRANPSEPYPLLWMGSRAHTFEARRRLYDLTVTHQRRAQVDTLLRYLTRGEIALKAQSVIVPDSLLRVAVTSTCAHSGAVQVTRTKPDRSVVATIPLQFRGEGVFRADTVVEIPLTQYGEYTVSPIVDGSTKSRSGTNVIVTSILLASENHYGQHQLWALDPIDGERLKGVTLTERDNTAYASRGDDRYTPSVWVGSGGQRPKPNTVASVWTDRSIYHPGDSLHFATTIYTYGNKLRELRADLTLTATLRDANYRPVGTVELTTDRFGRAEGSFVIPQEGLSGEYILAVGDFTSTSVTVSQYVAPTFEVNATAEVTPDSLMRVSGTAVGYNGFPQADAAVKVQLFTLERGAWWWRRAVKSALPEVYTATTTADGSFTLTAPMPRGENLLVRTSVTSTLGETRDVETFLPLKPYFISAEIANNELIDGAAPAITVSDARGEKVDLPITITLDDKAVTDWSCPASGRYCLKAFTADAQLADTLKIDGLTVYRTSDSRPPYDVALWVPQREVAAGERVTIGTTRPTAHVRCTLWAADSILSQQWVTISEGNHALDLAQLPAGIDDATLTLWSLSQYETTSRTVKVTRPAARALNVDVSTFRSSAQPGATERRTIRVTDNLGRPVSAALMLDVYAKALDALRPHSFAFNVKMPYYSTYRYWTSNGHRGTATASLPVVYRGVPDVGGTFDTYGQSWPRRGRTRAVGYGSSMRLYAAKAVATEEVATMESVNFAAADAGGDAVGMADSAEDEKENEAAEEYRLPETPLALWRPMLTTDANGVAEVEFLTPNANTTWQLRALAYDLRLLTGAASADFVASRPVMVQTAAPRAVRIGDAMALQASVMNCTDSALVTQTTMEIIDPVTEAVSLSRVFTDTIAARGYARLTLPWTADDATVAALRVRTTAGRYHDGEQAIISILPSEISVSNNHPIYLPADSATAVLQLPAGSTLEFTANAAWECALALPGLSESSPKTALAAASSLFSAATAAGLLRDYPQIAAGLRRFATEDSVAYSALQRNADLKIALLDNTPWPAAAQSDTERRLRLQLLFDRKEVSSTISQAVATLSKLVRSGGLTWCPGADEPSAWVTLRTLRTLGYLSRMGYTPDDATLQRIATDAVKWLDAYVAREYAKYPQTDFLEYALMRTDFADVTQSTAASRVSAAQVQRAASAWRDLSLSGRAKAALLLHRSGYKATARQITESLRQYQAWRQVGVTPLVLNAFAEIEPEAAEVEQIRSWLLTHKQTMDWGRGADATAVVAALLRSGEDWLVPADNQLTISYSDGRRLLPSESTMGSLRATFADSTTVTIAKGRFPAWGGIYERLTAESADIAEEGCEELHINRTIAGDFTVGGRVTVTLTIDADREMDYVVVRSPRPAATQAVEQLPGYAWLDACSAYREPCASETLWYLSRLPKGRTVITEELYVNGSGSFTAAPAEAQSQYAPAFTAHSRGLRLDLAK
jgi:hypothetical protein